MKMRLLILAITIFIGFYIPVRMCAQTMYVEQKNDQRRDINLNDMHKITFEEHNMNIQFKGNKSVFPISGIRFISFREFDTSIDKNAIQEDIKWIKIFPNPADDFFNISGINHEALYGTIVLTTLDGRTIFSEMLTGIYKKTIRLNYLENGIYLCRFYNNDKSQTIKIIKK